MMTFPVPTLVVMSHGDSVATCMCIMLAEYKFGLEKKKIKKFEHLRDNHGIASVSYPVSEKLSTIGEWMNMNRPSPLLFPPVHSMAA